MRNLVLLDLDGVLICTPSWKADVLAQDGYSAFDQAAVANFNTLMATITAELWLTSSRRWNKTLPELQTIFTNRGITTPLSGALPMKALGISRKLEIETFLEVYEEATTNLLILDDDKSLQNLIPAHKKYWVCTAPLVGFSTEKLAEAQAIITNYWR